MDESFSIEIVQKGQKLSFDARLVTVGYTHRFYVTINDLEVTYEPDEERNYRAMVNNKEHGHINDLDKELIQTVGDKIQQDFV